MKTLNRSGIASANKPKKHNEKEEERAEEVELRAEKVEERTEEVEKVKESEQEYVPEREQQTKEYTHKQEKQEGNKNPIYVLKRIDTYMNEYFESNRYFINLIFRWKRHFLVITIVAVAAAAVFSGEFFIPPKFKSYAVLYPSNIIPYSSETPSEQLLQLLESNDIRNSVIKKFDLAAHYKIDTTQESAQSKLIRTYESNVEVHRTEYNSIEITVYDTDPKMACNMVLEIIKGLNIKARNLQREKTEEVVVIFKNLMDKKKQQVDSIDAVLQELRVKYHLLDYDIQTKEVTRGYMNAVSSGSRKENVKDIDMLVRNLEEKGGEYYKTQQTLDVILRSYNTTKLDYDQALSDLNKELTYTNLVTQPFPADKKSYPVRWLIVVISVVSANAFLFLIVILIENIKNKTSKIQTPKPDNTSKTEA